MYPNTLCFHKFSCSRLSGVGGSNVKAAPAAASDILSCNSLQGGAPISGRRFWCTPLILLPRTVAACGLRMKGETPVNSTMSIGQARKMVEQLKIEASLCRIKVSKAATDLMTYCDAHACEDPLITPVPTSENPFREKKFFCALL
ncbi:guanine nucleotide-binding protein G(I)/G(S)/G(O) subunit gamma-3 isoform X1 [Hippopotamus amphibius kiboko]|uniref:guanine nucleotide-binding protein G(I)/G(S)/G(O) subunit gamma-3 isoform X1 n=2 Tax=Hippopotamus amphibius kiboko TaxID=575201 RepID=UPI00259216EF|nr:guanine nucleotide-binding protein G(I)/G(S)/G(O) subunit gamma-3 isoform X1 [Hippopotamus amphibius kiboko]XP_057582599.1 guanine nucleotide-binding protein G(I)/G(S)/G(O) subunit gamma-3 isoform X1 [Hippopotamus amphibius kiboko]XP_057582600.1 guanine nucleotide-binding protein G(I)/G(S)/G(O) subunit gamma-3 isoform X1 [Hippopotamus amphibius kiboko]XP_057582601.1 guanine nucleotide-binding protein G(I)/G(S)/G(O) subunit gamma-3 isoform X1 [Hippopotamus amphibius kiboko]